MGKTIHIHGVSVGEIQSAAPLVAALRQNLPDHPVLLTCWTDTSFALARKQYGADKNITITRLPLDLPWAPRGRFIKTHNIGFSLWIDSEIWPGWLMALKKRHIPSMIINGRLSERSYTKWKRFAFVAKWVLGHYARIDAQSEQDARHFNDLGGDAAVQPVNLKILRPPVTTAPPALEAFKNSIRDRPVILHASTHEGDEQRAFDLHNALRAAFPDLLSIILPRHAHRAKGLIPEALNKNLKPILRSEAKTIEPDIDILLGDTMGETAFYYALSPIVIMGKSFDPDHIGGQSPIEAAYAGCAILCGPYMTNFPSIMEDFRKADAITECADMAALETTVRNWLASPELVAASAGNAKRLAFDKAASGSAYLANVTEFVKTRIVSNNGATR